MKIMLSGGGTIGSVSPLLAVCQAIRQREPQTEFLWVATRRGPEHRLIGEYGIPIRPIFSGKLRRYASWRNITDPLLITIGFLQSLAMVNRFKPDAVLSAGGFVSVPLVLAAQLLGKPTFIHQQDVEPGLANKLMARRATVITTASEKSRADFPNQEVTVVGNPVRPDISAGSRQRGYESFQLDPNVPTVLIMGGGTGARRLNELVLESLPRLVTFCQVIHLTGGKAARVASHARYRGYDFLTSKLADAYAVADLVVSRAGMSALSELAATAKPTILIPISASHQEANATQFIKYNAALRLDERELTAAQLTTAIQTLLDNPVQRETLSRNLRKLLPDDAADTIADLVIRHYGRRS